MADPQTDTGYKNFTPPPGTPDYLATALPLRGAPPPPDNPVGVSVAGAGTDVANVAAAARQIGASSVPVPTGRQGVVDFWATKPGVPAHVAQGIADALGGESGFDPAALGDYNAQHDPTSIGLYQHHAERMLRLQQYAAKQGKSPLDPQVQNEFAWSEVNGGDPIATAHWNEIKNSPDRATARARWSQYFERPAALIRGGPDYSESRAALGQLQDRYASAAGDLRKLANDAIAKVNASSGDVGEMMRRVRAAQDRADQAQDMAFKAIAQIPKKPDIDGVKHATGLATIIGILGGLHTHAPMLASTNAAAAAIEAYNAGDLRNYKIAYDQWKTQSDLLFKVADMNVQRVRDIASNEKLGVDARRAQLDTYLRAAGLSQLADEALIKGDSAALDWAEKMESANRQFEERRFQITLDDRRRQDMLNRPVAVEKEGQPGLYYPLTQNFVPYPEGIRPVGGGRGGGATAQKAADTNAVIDADVRDYLRDHPNATAADIARARYDARVKRESELKGGATGRLSDEAADLLAQQYVMGDPGAITSMPRSGPARIQIENRIADRLRELPEAARNVVTNRLRMLEAQTAARTAGRVTMQTELFAQEAQMAGAELVRVSELVPRTESPVFNRALEAFYRQEGDPNIIRLGAALNALVNAYGKMSNPTGTGIHDADKERLGKTIDEALSKGQIKEGVDQIIREGQIISRAAQSAQQQVLEQLAPHVPGQTPPAIVPPLASGGAALPDGVPAGSKQIGTKDGHPVYEAPDGTRYWVH